MALATVKSEQQGAQLAVKVSFSVSFLLHKALNNV